MRGDQPPQRTSSFMRHFEIWFGAIFLSVGLVVLAVGLLLFRLLRDDPDVGDGAWFALAIPTLVGSIFLLIGGIFFYRGQAKAQREQFLRESGTVTNATVVAVEPTYTTVNGRRQWHVRYVYDDLSGISQTGESGYLSAEEAGSYRVGQQAFVRYDPEHPSESLWLGRDQDGQ